MATINGTCYRYGGAVNSGYTYWVDYSYTQDIANNQSSVTVKSYLKSNGSYSTVSSQWVATICGTTYGAQSITVGSATTTHQLGSTKTFTVNHNSDGTGSFSISASFTNGLTSDSQYTIKKGSITTQTITLPTIPRSSSIGTISGTTIGGNMTVNISRASSAFTHHIRLHFGNYNSTVMTGVGTSGTFTVPLALLEYIKGVGSGNGAIYVQTYNGGTKIGGEVGKSVTLYSPVSSIGTISGSTTLGGTMTIPINRGNNNITHTVTVGFGNQSASAGTNVTTSANYTLPIGWSNQVPNSTSGTGTVYVTAYYNGWQVGSQTTKQFTVYLPSSVVPTADKLALVAKDTMGDALVQGKSYLTAQFLGVTGAYGSSIKTYSINGHVMNVSDWQGNSGILTSAGTHTYTATATDSRGRTVTKTATATVHAYSSPTITHVSFTRCTKDGLQDNNGAYAKLSFNSYVTNIANNNANRKGYKVEIKEKTETTWRVWSEGTPSAYSVTNTLAPSSGFDISKSYDCRITLSDSYHTIVSTSNISTVSCAFNVEPNGIGIGKYWEKGGLDVKGEIHTDSLIHATGGTVDGRRIVGKQEWSAQFATGAWQRLFHFTGSGVVGSCFIVHIGYTRGNVVNNVTLMVNAGHSYTCNITQLGNISYTTCGFRGVIDGNGKGYFEIYEGVAGSTQTGAYVTVMPIYGLGNVTPYPVAQSGSNLPSGHNIGGGWIDTCGGSALVSRKYQLISTSPTTGGGNKGSLELSGTGDIVLTSASGYTATQHLYPRTTNYCDIGSASYRYRTIYSINALNTSDSREKENIVRLNHIETTLMTLDNHTNSELYSFVRDMPLYEYDYKCGGIGQHQTGFLADELMNINPDMASRFIYIGNDEVEHMDIIDENNIDDNAEFLRDKYADRPIFLTSTHSYVANLHLALQETMKKLDRLETLVETLLNEKVTQ